MIRKPAIIIPSLTKNQYKEIYKKTGSYVVYFYLNVSNQFNYARSEISSIFRGKFRDTEIYDRDSIPFYIFVFVFFSLALLLFISTFAVYKIYKRCGKKKINISQNEEFSPNRVKFIFSSRGLI